MTMRAIMICLAFVATACAAPREAASPPPSPLLSVTADQLGRELMLSQQVAAVYDDRTIDVRYEIEVADGKAAIVGLTLIGVPLFSVVATADGVETETYGQALPFDVGYVLSDLYLTYWPATVLDTALAPLGQRLEVSADGQERRIRDSAGDLLVAIRYDFSGVISLRHFDLPYRLRITPLDTDLAR
jgi:hypothetical protein